MWVYPKRMDLSPDGKYIVYDSFARTMRAIVRCSSYRSMVKGRASSSINPAIICFRCGLPMASVSFTSPITAAR